MQAAVYTRQGPARDVLEVATIPTPSTDPGEVLVRIHTSGVNPSDVKSRSGLMSRTQAFPRIIPHSDGAGVIEAVGDGVDGARIGERVWIWNGQWKRAEGTAAEYIALPSAQAVRLPDQVDFDVGACFGIPLMTAVQAVDLSGIGPGDAVLISGGAGAVAHYAIQVAKRRGARVLTTVSTDEKAAAAKRAGADDIINYREQDVGERIAALSNGRGVDAIIELDLTANARVIPQALRPYGTVVAYGMSDDEPKIPGRWMLRNNATLKLFLIYEITQDHRRRVLAEIDALLHGDGLVHQIAHRIPLRDVVRAHELVEEGRSLGNVVVAVT